MTPTVIVFSRDRACQLDALLRSIETRLRGVPIPGATIDGQPATTTPVPFVLWTASNDELAAGYGVCAAEHPWSLLIRERDFHADLRQILEDADTLVCFFTDDDVVHGDASLADAAGLLDDERVIAFSYRLGENTTYCYPLDLEQPLPVPRHASGRVMTWPWKDARHDFAYPLSLDGHVIRVTDLRDALDGHVVRNPNELEQVIASRVRAALPHRPRLASYTRSVVTGIPANRVNETHPNRCADEPPYGFTAAFLNDRYLAGERIDLDDIDFSGVRGAHEELELRLS